MSDPVITDYADHNTIADLMDMGAEKVSAHCATCRMIRVRPLAELAEYLTVADLRERAVCSDCGARMTLGKFERPWSGRGMVTGNGEPARPRK